MGDCFGYSYIGNCSICLNETALTYDAVEHKCWSYTLNDAYYLLQIWQHFRPWNNPHSRIFNIKNNINILSSDHGGSYSSNAQLFSLSSCGSKEKKFQGNIYSHSIWTVLDVARRCDQYHQNLDFTTVTDFFDIIHHRGFY